MGFNEWVTITTIGLSLVSIGIAIYSARSTSKDANRQIEKIKELTQIQLTVAIETLQSDAQIYLASYEKAKSDKAKFDKQFGGLYIMMTPAAKECTEKEYQQHCLSSQQMFDRRRYEALAQKIEVLEKLKSEFK